MSGELKAKVLEVLEAVTSAVKELEAQTDPALGASFALNISLCEMILADDTLASVETKGVARQVLAKYEAALKAVAVRTRKAKAAG